MRSPFSLHLRHPRESCQGRTRSRGLSSPTKRSKKFLPKMTERWLHPKTRKDRLPLTKTRPSSRRSTMTRRTCQASLMHPQQMTMTGVGNRPPDPLELGAFRTATNEHRDAVVFGEQTRNLRLAAAYPP